MNVIRVSKVDLLVTLRDNRDQHRTIFLEAIEGYRKAAIEELDKMLQEAKSGLKIRRQVMLTEPEDHTRDYNRVIRMLEMSQDTVIELSEGDFAQYVMDDWRWKRQFLITNSVYSSTARSTPVPGEENY